MTHRAKRPYHHTDLREALIQEVLQALGRGDAERLSMRELANRVGVSHTAAYAHFADKAALWRAVADVGFDRLHAVLQKAVAAADSPATALSAAGLAYLAFARAMPALYALMFGAVSLSASPAAGPLGNAAFETLVAAVAALPLGGAVRPAARTTADALTAWSLVHGLACLEAAQALGEDHAGGANELHRQAVATLVRGLATTA